MCKKRKHFVVMDSAYQGFASGSPEADAASLRMFVEDGHQVAISSISQMHELFDLLYFFRLLFVNPLQKTLVFMDTVLAPYPLSVTIPMKPGK